MMRLTFLGAARMVTGSSFLLECQDRKILIDCGMFQGGQTVSALNRRPFPYHPADIDCVILTHAHIDHCGLLPRLTNEGFRGPIYTSKVTTALANIMLPDSAHIQEFDSELQNRKGRRAGREQQPPLYTVDDAYRCLKQFTPVRFNQTQAAVPGVEFRFCHAGHILGSAVIEIWVTEADKTTKLVFSGDLGQPDQPIIKDADIIEEADFVVIESTYGDRVHDYGDKTKALAAIITDTVNRGGNVVIPAFAVGRTQNLLYYLRELLKAELIPAVPIIIDSPMAISVTDVFMDHPEEYDDEATEIIKEHEHPLKMPNLQFAKSLEESKAINFLDQPAIIISASGMADAGRILHHLKHNLWRPESSVLLVGFQAQGSLGRRLVDGAKRVRILGEQIRVNAEIHNLDGFSAHADRNQLLAWLETFKKRPQAAFIVHGELEMAVAFAQAIKTDLEIESYIPQYGDEVLISGSDWSVKESDIVLVNPAIRQVHDRLFKLEERYRQYRRKVERKINSNHAAATDLSRRLERLERALDNLFDDI